MPATISRLLMCFGVLIGAVIVYLIIMIGAGEVWDFDTAWILAGVGSSLVFAAGWTLVWRGGIHWTAQRTLMTLILVPGALIPAGLLWFIGAKMLIHDNSFGVFLGTLTWVTTWLIGSALIWRENAAERGARLRRLGIHAVACPDCGYNLTGLKEAKCPECGAAYTLDQLYASIIEQRVEIDND